VIAIAIIKKGGNMQLIETRLELDCRTTPFGEVMRLANSFGRRDKKPDNKRLAILWLALTGARPCEIENRKVREIILNKYWVWHPRKKQSGMRKELLPDWFWKEFNMYLEYGKYSNDDIFGLKGDSLASYINHHVRDKLRGRWLVKRPEFMQDGRYRLVYVYKLKSLRHNFASTLWYNLRHQYGDEVSISMVAKRMRHSDQRITARHYIESIEALNLNKYGHKNMGDILKLSENRNLLEFVV